MFSHETVLTSLLYFVFFIFADCTLQRWQIQGRYYLLHLVHNCIVVVCCWPDMIHCITHLRSDIIFGDVWNYTASWLCISFYSYHTILYRKRFTKDEIKHHVIMMCFCLPIVSICEIGISISLVFISISGIPGILIFTIQILARYGVIQKKKELMLTMHVYQWIRTPMILFSCSLFWTLSLMDLSSHLSIFQNTFRCLASIGLYWNGIYFMHVSEKRYFDFFYLSKDTLIPTKTEFFGAKR